jgi:phosphate-selective porin
MYMSLHSQVYFASQTTLINVKKKTTLCMVSLLTAVGAQAQDTAPPALSNDSLTKEVRSLNKIVGEFSKLKVTGWIQAQFQTAESKGIANFDGGAFAPNSDMRFMIRRGRVKFTYNGKNTQYVMQLNGSERGFNLVEAYIVAMDPWKKGISLTFGVMNRPFGFEIDQSSSVRESPERSRYTQTLMPNERDLGAKITIAPPKGSKLYGLRLDAGFYNGQGIFVGGPTAPAGYPANTSPLLGVYENDSQKDFIGRLCYYRDLSNDKIRVGIGTSHYNGGNMATTNRMYNTIVTDSLGRKYWQASDTLNHYVKGKTAPRLYYGLEGFFSLKSLLGTTTIRGEYIWGTQSATQGSSSSPFYFLTPTDSYVRNFNGMYVYFIQRLGKSKHEIAVKYDWYDPNTKVNGRDIIGTTGGKALTAADIKYTQLGLTYTWYAYENVKFMFNYNIIKNEVTGNGTNFLTGFDKDIKDNIFTARVQYKF